MKHFILESAKIMRHVADNNVKVRLDSIYCFLQFVWLGFYKGDACLHSRAMFCTRHWHVRLSQFLCHRAHSQRNESRDLPALCQCAPISTAGSTEAMKVHNLLKLLARGRVLTSHQWPYDPRLLSYCSITAPADNSQIFHHSVRSGSDSYHTRLVSANCQQGC